MGRCTAVRIHINTAGHTKYAFDFSCTYVDDREVLVNVLNVKKDGASIDDTSGTIQNLIEDYVRHIHECAQALHPTTHM